MKEQVKDIKISIYTKDNRKRIEYKGLTGLITYLRDYYKKGFKISIILEEKN